MKPGYSPGIRDKLIGIFVLIKVLPLIVLAWFAWNEIAQLAKTLETHVNQTARESLKTTRQVGNLASQNSIRALDNRSREAIERLTTDTARQVADFLYQRDRDIRFLASLKPDRETYQKFIETQTRPVTRHGLWIEKAGGWRPVSPGSDSHPGIDAQNPDNSRDFHYRPPEDAGIRRDIPLYLEITYVDTSGQEIIKVTGSDRVSSELVDVSDPRNTYCRAETYFSALQALDPGEIHVSDVIGAYVKTHMIGPYTVERAVEKGIPFLPRESGYAGKENPVGKRFKGLIRWASPVIENGQISGFVTLALDHDHIMEFTDHIKPTEERYSDISDPASGNYAFMWDHKGRSISHPRDYFITGYDPETGEPVMPWLDTELYGRYLDSGLPVGPFLDTLPAFDHQSLQKKPAPELTRQGTVALDCRYLNFAPQCDGWHNITRHGGSGSFVIFWSGLLKLTTAATIPYFTGPYNSPRGFGFVTIGANVKEFHKPALETADAIQSIEKRHLENINRETEENQALVAESGRKTAIRLTLYTGAMILAVILIAILMASTLTAKITTMIKGIHRFEKGDMAHRLDIRSTDEMGELGNKLNRMADHIQKSFSDLRGSREAIEQANVKLKNEIQERIQAEKKLNLYQDQLEELVHKRTLEIGAKIEELEALKDTLHSIVNSMPSVIIGVDTDERITLWNREAENITGVTPSQALTNPLSEVVPLSLLDKKFIAEAIREKVVKREEKHRIQTESETRCYDVTVYPLKEAEGAVIRVDDVTQRVRMEERIIQSEKMNSIGSLAAGMAHEINNPLAGIMQNVQVARNRIEADLPKNRQVAESLGITQQQVRDYLDRRNVLPMFASILTAGKRAAEIVENMLSFSREGSAHFESCDLTRLLENTLEIVQNDYDLKKKFDAKNIVILREYDPRASAVRCDKSKIQQVFFNILKNGVQAMMQDQDRTEPPRFILRHRSEHGMAVVEMEDNGPGMDADTKVRIFEPFFTTKPVGVGTGLGLYISYFIVAEDHHGTISVRSEKGKGAVFTIRLPLR